MSKSPGLFIDIGRKARDLLYKDYAQQLPLHFEYQSFDCNFDLACQIEEIAPGLHTAFRFIIPDSGKVELRYLHDYIGITSGVGLKAISNDSTGLDHPKLKANPSDKEFDPIVNFSGVIGSNLFSLGAESAFDISTGTFKYNAGLSFNSAFLIASLTLSDLNTLRTSYYQSVNPLSRTAIAAELKHRFVNNGTTTFTVGGQHALFPSTLVKARMDSDGKVGALIQQDLLKKLYLSVAGEVDFRDMDRFPKIGFSIALRP
ncbi:hypothetical protein JRO89_XS13G0175700 [Xanthoceras sorbifolium]|uniref:Uncharacterized protein n=1 Tax=Xanthoceras sorbifolium TaxID=99658 RepID=A0ABQ8H8Z9_9ROSI|nr:hypothetical protein JRO89_XS13G0175700 [Xanthoceras sorbifolium]